MNKIKDMISEMKTIAESKGCHFFSEENQKEWELKFEDEPNELGLFITSGNRVYSFEPADENNRTYCLKAFCSGLGYVEGIITKSRGSSTYSNYASFEDAAKVKAALTRRLTKNPSFKGKAIFAIGHDFDHPTEMMFISENGGSELINLDDLSEECMK